MRKCFFCQYKTAPNFREVENIEKFLSPRKKIISREKTSVCAKHQRLLSKNIKYARYLGLIPYVSYKGVK